MKLYKLIFLFLIISGLVIKAQPNLEKLKRQAILHMSAERYGEAVDLLNKYVTSKARDAEGYNLRGLCFEKREFYQNAVLDFRRAVRLEPDNQEFNQNLQRARTTWDQILFKRIEGYKREIAINPSNPVNYLGVGLSYRWLEDWAKAEVWYDKYLSRDPDASPDEIIRYTEILSHTGSISKGEKKLAKWVKKHPEDWRLWSRYGYFTMWLGKYENAKKAFNNALEYKPFFKEAQDGLDLAEKKGYLTAYRPRSFEREYPIDRFYRILKKEPENSKLRYKLAEHLIRENRLEEAHQQLSRLQDEYGDSEKFTTLLDSVENVRDSLYQTQVEYYKSILTENPTDKEAIKKLARNYSRLYMFDEAIEVLVNYTENHSSGDDEDVKYMLARYAAWNYEWDIARQYSAEILEKDPENSLYQILRAQINVWTVQDLDESRELLEAILENNSENIQAVLTLVSVLVWQKEFESAREYLDKVKKIDPSSPELEAAESNYAIHLSAYEELQIVQLKVEAAELSKQGDCIAAVEKYDEYLSKITGPNREEQLEYADFNICAENYEKALDIYNNLLKENFEDFDVKLRRAKVYYWMQDTLAVLEEFAILYKEEPGNYEVEMFLGHSYLLNKEYENAIEMYEMAVKKIEDPDIEEQLFQSKFAAKLSIGDAYQKMEEYGEAEDLYKKMLEETTDTSEIRVIKQRINWLPEYGAGKFFGAIINSLLPNYMGVSPVAGFYADNQDLSYYQFGGRMFLGLNNYISVGGEWLRTNITSDNITGKSSSSSKVSGKREFTGMKGIGILNYTQEFVLSGYYGQIKTLNEPTKYEWGGDFRAHRKKIYEITLQYKHTDSRLLLYSPYILNERSDIDYYRFSALYYHKELFKISTVYDYLDIKGNIKKNGSLKKNSGNNFIFRVGKRFVDTLYVGYEFRFSDYGEKVSDYYSPQNYEAHSLWADYYFSPAENMNVELKAVLGYAPGVDYVLRSISGEALYQTSEKVQISLKLSVGSSYRYQSAYNYVSGQLSVYISI